MQRHIHRWIASNVVECCKWRKPGYEINILVEIVGVHIELADFNRGQTEGGLEEDVELVE